jgi:hypothetical protein
VMRRRANVVDVVDCGGSFSAAIREMSADRFGEVR